MTNTPQRDQLLPYMKAYLDAFSDDGRVNWEPYTVYFHPRNYSSDVVNTDRYGFRVSLDGEGRRVSVGSELARPVNIVAGSSTTFGIGASTDAHTLASLLAREAPDGAPWLNFGGRSFNAIQEYLIAALHQHRLPRVDQIVLLSGFNNLGLARQPVELLGEHGTFFMRARYEELTRRTAPRRSLLPARRFNNSTVPSTVLSLERQIDFAVETTHRSFRLWKSLSEALGAQLTFVLQPLANWVRETGSPEESVIFEELDTLGRFTDTYGSILASDVHANYSERLCAMAVENDSRYVDGVTLMRDHLEASDWAYVDRIHFTDGGHATFARALISEL